MPVATVEQHAPSARPGPLMERRPMTGASAALVLAADFHDPESFAVHYARYLAHGMQAALVFEHIPDPVLWEDPDELSLPAPQAQTLAREVMAAARHAPATLHNPLERQALLQAVVEGIARHRPGMILIASQSQSEVGRLLLGIVARRLSLHCRVPTLVLGPARESSLMQAGHWRRVLAATDFTASGASVLLRAHQLAERELVALHCVGESGVQMAPHWVEHLRMLAPFNESHTIPVQHLVETGDTRTVILQVAKKVHADLIVLGSATPRRAGVKTVDSIICSVISQAVSPVLLVPDDADHQQPCDKDRAS